jgi:hypothetical protein
VTRKGIDRSRRAQKGRCLDSEMFTQVRELSRESGQTSARHTTVSMTNRTDCVEIIKWHQRRRRWTASLHREFSSTDLNERRPTTRVRYPATENCRPAACAWI